MRIFKTSFVLVIVWVLLGAIGCSGSKSTEPATQRPLPPGRIPQGSQR
jgi:hypothetical protein